MKLNCCTAFSLSSVFFCAATAHGHPPAKLPVTGGDVAKIDMHTHIFPEWYHQEILASGWVPGPAGSNSPKWNVSMHLDFMQQQNIETAYISASSPGTVLYTDNKTYAVDLTRRWNDYCAELKRNYTGKFGFYASLPLPYVNESLAEIDRALDQLGADAFIIYSNTNGQYPGDPTLKPVLDKLDALGVTILLHPNTPCPSKGPAIQGTPLLDHVAPLMDNYGAPSIEFFFETSRAVMDLILSGTAVAYPRLKWIIPHAGACLPSILDRFTRLQSVLGAKPGSDRVMVAYSPQNATELMQQRFWFDLAGFSMGQQIWGIARLFGPDKFVFGSEIPFTPVFFANQQISEMYSTLPQLYHNDSIAAIFRYNALKLLGKK